LNHKAWISFWELYNAVGAGWLLGFMVYVGSQRHRFHDALGGEMLAPCLFFAMLAILVGNYLNFHTGVAPRYELPAVLVSISVTFGYLATYLAWRRS
jgi:hypothetical protein